MSQLVPVKDAEKNVSLVETKKDELNNVDDIINKIYEVQGQKGARDYIKNNCQRELDLLDGCRYAVSTQYSPDQWDEECKSEFKNYLNCISKK
jgi:hypothetical protein